MTPPDELVKAAVEAIPLTLDTRYRLLEQERRQVARLAVAAVLRAPPECEALVEELADVEHERWSKWMCWVYQHGTRHIDGSFTIQPDRAKRWRFLSQVPYADLDSETQEHDRVEARTSLAAIAKFGKPS